MALIAGDQRIVSVLAADVVGSTTIGERLGPERSKFLFDEIVGHMAASVRRYDGTVAQLLGDGLIALFGAPVAHEDDAERAVRAALLMQRRISRYARDVESAYGITVGARVAINTGPVIVPAGGDLDVAERYNALGDTVNVAARLQAEGIEGSVVVAGETARQVEETFALESLGELELRGRQDAVEAFRVTGDRSPSDQRDPAVPLVGRDFDVAALEHSVDSLADGRGVIISITGEPGIGKSRLAAELRRRAGDQHLLPRGTSVRLRREHALLADPRPPAQLAGCRLRHPRGPGPARAAGRAGPRCRGRRLAPVHPPGRAPGAPARARRGSTPCASSAGRVCSSNNTRSILLEQ